MDDNKEIIRLLNELNSNIKILSRITAYSMRKENPAQEKKKESLQDQLSLLDGLDLPDNIIALLLGSTLGSIQTTRSVMKSKKSPKPTTPKKPEVKPNEQ